MAAILNPVPDTQFKYARCNAFKSQYFLHYITQQPIFRISVLHDLLQPTYLMVSIITYNCVLLQTLCFMLKDYCNSEWLS